MSSRRTKVAKTLHFSVLNMSLMITLSEQIITIQKVIAVFHTPLYKRCARIYVVTDFVAFVQLSEDVVLPKR